MDKMWVLSSEGNPHPDTNRKQCRRGVQLLCDENTNVSFLGRYQCRYLKQTSERVSSYTLDDRRVVLGCDLTKGSRVDAQDRFFGWWGLHRLLCMVLISITLYKVYSDSLPGRPRAWSRSWVRLILKSIECEMPNMNKHVYYWIVLYIIRLEADRMPMNFTINYLLCHVKL